MGASTPPRRDRGQNVPRTRSASRLLPIVCANVRVPQLTTKTCVLVLGAGGGAGVSRKLVELCPGSELRAGLAVLLRGRFLNGRPQMQRSG